MGKCEGAGALVWEVTQIAGQGLPDVRLSGGRPTYSAPDRNPTRLSQRQKELIGELGDLFDAESDARTAAARFVLDTLREWFD